MTTKQDSRNEPPQPPENPFLGVDWRRISREVDEDNAKREYRPTRKQAQWGARRNWGHGRKG